MSKEARNKARELRLQQQREAERKKKRNAIIGWAGGIIIVALLAAIVVVVINAAGKNSSTSNAGGNGTVTAPAGATANGGIVIGESSAPVTVQVYFDYMCPYCGQFEKANSSELSRLIYTGKLKLELHPLNFLDEQSNGGRYSTRSANALATVADKVPGLVLAFNTALFTDQPKEGTKGLSDDKIADVAKNAGVPAAVADSFTAGTYEGWITQSTQTALTKDGVSATPTIKINGKVFGGDLLTAGPLTQAIEAAAGSKG
jgi:protein-disulfide isomerase